MTYEDDLEEHLLVNLHELLVPLVDVGSLFPVVIVIIRRLSGVIAVVLAPLHHLAQNGVVDVRDGDGAGNGLVAEILH